MEEIEREEKRAEQLSAAESERFKRKINEIDDAAEKDAKKAKAVDRSVLVGHQPLQAADHLPRNPYSRLHQRFQTNPKYALK